MNQLCIFHPVNTVNNDANTCIYKKELWVNKSPRRVRSFFFTECSKGCKRGRGCLVVLACCNCFLRYVKKSFKNDVQLYHVSTNLLLKPNWISKNDSLNISTSLAKLPQIIFKMEETLISDVKFRMGITSLTPYLCPHEIWPHTKNAGYNFAKGVAIVRLMCFLNKLWRLRPFPAVPQYLKSMIHQYFDFEGDSEPKCDLSNTSTPVNSDLSNPYKQHHELVIAVYCLIMICCI